MVQIQENIEEKKSKSMTKYGFLGIGFYFLLLVGLKIGVANFNNILFWVMMAFGVTGSTVLILLTGRAKDRIKNMVDGSNDFNEKIIKDAITIPEAYNLFYDIITNHGFSAIYKDKHILSTHGDEVRRRIFILYFTDEYNGNDYTFLISMSEPQHYTILDTQDGRAVDNKADSLAYAKEKEPVMIREQRYITGEDGEKKKIETLTEKVPKEKEEDEE